MKLRAGDWVEVRSKEEILRSLDKKGRLDELPFMPQMFQYCGQRFRVYKRAHKTCDTVDRSGGRWVPNTVHLDLRCDGKAHGGCQAACLIFWKDAWLRPVKSGQRTLEAPGRSRSVRGNAPANDIGCSEHAVLEGTRAAHETGTNGPTYVCQATQLPLYTRPLRWWDIRQYLEDYRSRNITLGRMLRGFVYACFFYSSQSRRRLLPAAPLRSFYDWFQSLVGGIPYPRHTGTLPAGKLTPASTLNLQAGELVRIKSYQEILATLGPDNKNRGLFFDAELVPYCGREYRVKAIVTRFINEKTGKMTSPKTPAVILEGVWCQSRYSSCRFFCPRSIHSWWREVWLERVAERSPNRSESMRQADEGSSKPATYPAEPPLAVALVAPERTSAILRSASSLRNR